MFLGVYADSDEWLGDSVVDLLDGMFDSEFDAVVE